MAASATAAGKAIKSKPAANNRTPVPEATKASNGLTYKSNTKHTPGGGSNRLNAGVEPKNSLELFGNTYQSGNKRYAVDSQGNIHQFTYEGVGSNTWHWAGRTGLDQPIQQRMNGNNIPHDVIKHFKLDPKKVKKL